MKKKFGRGSIILCLCIVFTLMPFSSEKASAATGSMNIYGIYMGSFNGDATLVESQGEYLLMDLGTASSYSYIKQFLDEKGVSRLSVYLSHWHTDHTGGLSVDGEDIESGFKNLLNDYEIENIYIPDQALYYDMMVNGAVYEALNYTKLINIVKIYELVEQYGMQEGCGVVQLSEGSEFSFGDVTADVIGPVDVEEDVVNDYADYAGAYVNNRSLVTQLTCGDTVYLNAGDIGSPQEKKLAERYGNDLKSDIYKMSHHGYWSSNTSTIMSYIRPSYSYATCDQSTANRYDSVTRCSHLGMTYMVGWEGENICYSVNNDVIQVYRSADAGFGEPLSGWVRVIGGKGTAEQKYDFYYISDDNYRLLTGVSEVDGNYYYFHTGGLLITGTYDGTGAYDPWRSHRYIYEGSNDNPAGFMLAIGLVQLGDDLYYFKPSTGQYKVGRQEIDGEYYAFDSDGLMIRDAVYYSGETISGYADETGVLKSGFYWIGTKLYYADWSGRILKGDSSKTWTVTEINGNLYAVHKKGHIRYCIIDGDEEEITLSGKKYMVDTEGMLTYKAPETVAVKWAKPYKDHVTVRWTKTQNATGYEVFVSTKKNGKYTKAATISGSQTYAIISNLKSNTKYYVKVRAYAEVQGEKIVGDYSEILSVKAPKTTK